MKKIILIISLFIVTLVASGQQGVVSGYYVKAIKAMVLNGDTIRLTSPSDGEVLMRVSGKWKNMPSASYSAVDSMAFNIANGYLYWYKGGSISDSISIDGRYAELDTLDNYIQEQDSGVAYITPKQLTDSLNVLSPQVVFEIKLPSASTVAGRVSGATPGVDFPIDWTLSQGSTPTDLLINHGLNRRVSIVSIFAIDGSNEQQLFNTAAYNGIITTSGNQLKIQSLATIQKAIKIYIIFV